MPDYTTLGISFPVPSDAIKRASLEAKLADDIRLTAVTANQAIITEGGRVEAAAKAAAAADASAKDAAIDAKATSAVSTANNALAVSSDASADAGNAVDRVTALESAAGFGPSTPTDGTMASFISNPATLTAAAIDSVSARAENVSETNGTLAELQSALNRAAANGVPLHVYGTYNLDGSLAAPSGADVDMVGIDQPKIHQTVPLTPHMVGANVRNFRAQDIEFVGHGGDYENTQNVYGATALRFTGANEDIDLERVKITGIAGAGVFVESGATKRVRVAQSVITGVGQATTVQYSGGIVIQDGIQDVDLDANDISQIAQGIGVGHGSKRIRTTFNRIHHTSEHGAYFAASDDYIIIGNHFYDTGLLGAKIQRGKAGAFCRAAIVDDNIFERTGSHAFMVTNAGIGDTEKFIRNFAARGNLAYDIVDTAFRLDHVDKYSLATNMIDGARFGIRVFDSNGGRIRSNDVWNTERPGYWLENISNTRFESNTGHDLGLLGPEKVGMHVLGNVSNLDLMDNDMDYSTVGAQADGYLFGTGTYSNIRLRSNRGRGSNWGFRIAAAASGITEWSRNMGHGALGASDTYPAGFVPNLADSSGYSLASLEVEVNKIKAIARLQRDARN